MSSKMVNIILILCVIGLIVMSIIEIGNNIAEAYEEQWKPTEIYEFTNKNIDWV